MPSDPLRVCYFGTYRSEYSRNKVMIASLRACGVQVIECNEPLWGSVEDRVQLVGGGWKNPGFWFRILKVYWRLAARFFKLPDYDVLVIGYPGQFDVFLARLLAWLRRKTLAWDVFMSIFLIAQERELDKRNRVSVGFLRAIEWAALRLPDMLLQDTAAYAAWFEDTHGLPASRFCLVPTGADERIFSPQDINAEDDRIKILYYGSYIPNHHVQTILAAASLLQDRDGWIFEMIGDGPDRALAQEYANVHQLKNMRFVEWLPGDELVGHIAAADICLGAFGVTPQSLMTVHNKIYECLAMKKAVVSGDSPAVRQALEPGQEIWLVPRQDPQALAGAITKLAGDPGLRKTLGENGYVRYRGQYSLEQLGRTYRDHLRKLFDAKR